MHIDEIEHKCIKSTKEFTRGELYRLIPTKIEKDDYVLTWFCLDIAHAFTDDFKKSHFDQIYFENENRVTEFG